MAKKILIVEDDKDINKLITMNLQSQNYDVESLNDGNQGLKRALEKSFDAIILDIMLPGTDGLNICKELRRQKVHTPLLMLTARDGEIDRVLGLEMGADDYLTKPFSIRELQARIKALLRRSALNQQSEEAEIKKICVGDLIIYCDRREVFVDKKAIELTGTEFDLLVFLASNPGKVFNRSKLLDQVWGYQHSGYEHTVNSHINRLRTKIEKDSTNPEHILTVWGTGYKFNDQVNIDHD